MAYTGFPSSLLQPTKTSPRTIQPMWLQQGSRILKPRVPHPTSHDFTWVMMEPFLSPQDRRVFGPHGPWGQLSSKDCDISVKGVLPDISALDRAAAGCFSWLERKGRPQNIFAFSLAISGAGSTATINTFETEMPLNKGWLIPWK